jgi:hypothetical protein
MKQSSIDDPVCFAFDAFAASGCSGRLRWVAVTALLTHALVQSCLRIVALPLLSNTHVAMRIAGAMPMATGEG